MHTVMLNLAKSKRMREINEHTVSKQVMAMVLNVVRDTPLGLYCAIVTRAEG